jgi:acylphosphatase
VIRVYARIEGRVQGVCFRAETRIQAQAHGLVGWVRNTADGAVELEAEGPRESVSALLKWCYGGPPAARVDGLTSREVAITGGQSFEIRYGPLS